MPRPLPPRPLPGPPAMHVMGSPSVWRPMPPRAEGSFPCGQRRPRRRLARRDPCCCLPG